MDNSTNHKLSPELSLKRSLISECFSNTLLNKETSRIEFFWEGPVPKAGQFFLVKPKRTSVFLARPFSAASWRIMPPPEKDKPGCILCFIVLNRGRGTEELMDIRPGEKAELTGPLGNTWAEVGDFKMPVALIGGGVGIAPMVSYAEELNKNGFEGFDFYAGFKNKSYGIENIKSRLTVVASEDGSEGKKGRILEFFRPDEYNAVFACGPMPLLHALAVMCKNSGVPCFVSMEKHMACGTGACLGCTIKTHRGNLRCCADGPIINALELNFE